MARPRFFLVAAARHRQRARVQRLLANASLDKRITLQMRISAPAAAEGHRVLERLLPASSSGLAAVESISSASISSASSRVMDRPASAASARRLGCAVAGSPRDHPAGPPQVAPKVVPRKRGHPQILILVYTPRAVS